MILNFGIYDGVKGGAAKTNKLYITWVSMIERCYSPKMLDKNPTYKGTTVCDEWRYYSKFEEWAKSRYVDGYSLDKDIIDSTSRIYSPFTCAFVPAVVNSCILDKITNTEYPLGVSYFKKDKNMVSERTKPYRTTISKFCKVHHIGLYSTIEEAHLHWQTHKVEYLKNIVDEYKDLLDEKVILGLSTRIQKIEDDILNGRITQSINVK